MRWSAQQHATLDGARTRSAAGEPVTLVITGAPGTGKSALLEELVAQAEGFGVIRAEGFPGPPTAYETLDQLGVRRPAVAGAERSRTLAAQQVRAWLDDRLAGGPVLIAIDDGQWVDEESLSALVAVMRRTVAEPILFALATRPLEADQRLARLRWDDRVDRLELTGLELDAARELLAELRPELAPETVEALWGHVDGNPLYLRALAEEHDAAELARLPVLPAPARFAATVTTRLGRLSPAANALARAAAVLGDGWSPLRDVAAVAEVSTAEEVTRAADELTAAGLAVARADPEGLHLRLAHSLVRSAIYQASSIEDRRRRHERAAATLSGVSAVFEHRLAAAAGYDDELAADLARHATSLREQRSFGAAARYQQLAAGVTADPAERESRWLDSLFDRLMATDREGVRSQLAALQDAGDPRRRDLVLAVLALWERRPFEAVQLLRPWCPGAEEDRDVWQFRLETMLAWALLMADAPESEISDALARAESLPVADAVVGRYGMLARAQVEARHLTSARDLPAIDDLPEDPRRVPLAATSRLAWRGTFRATAGHFSTATDDLVELTDRMQQGRIEFSSGSYHAILGRAQWFAGDWARARVTLRTAAELAGEYSHPIVAASLALPAIGEGALTEADELLERARALLGRVPWREAVDQLTIAEIIRAHADGATTPELFAGLEPALAELRDGRVAKNVVWTVHAGLVAVWAGAAAVVTDLARSLDRSVGGAAWAPASAEWLRGLAAEAGGDGKLALAHLSAATQGTLTDVPLYRAHVHADHARVAHLVQGAGAAARSLEIATAGYRALGARRYLERLEALRRVPAGEPAASSARPVIQLTERERDVLTLVVSGMSYAQVARDLFITQSTVSYHLGNIYAKTDVSSRHQLSQLARSDPGSLGLPALSG